MNRNRESIPIMGINTSSPGHTVKDGACEDVLNLRYFNDALQNVCKPDLLQPITNSNGYNIVHRVDAMPQGHYIAVVQKLNDAVNLVVVHIVGGVVDAVDDKSWFGVGPIGGFRFSSFGNVLYVTCDSGEYLQEDCYIYKDDKFTKFNMDEIKPPEFTIELERKIVSNINRTDPRMNPFNNVALSLMNVSSNGVLDYLYMPKVKEASDEGYITGGFYVTLAYKLFDGNIIYPGNLMFVSSNIDKIVKCLPDAEGYYYDYEAYGVNAIKAKIKISNQNQAINSNIIKEIVVLTSRVNLVYDFSKTPAKFIASPVTKAGFLSKDNNGQMTDLGLYYDVMDAKYIIDKDCFDVNQPLYELSNINTGDSSFLIDYDKIKDVEHSPVYKASFSNHTTIAAQKFEYNNRLHAFNLKTNLCAGYNLAAPLGTDIEYSQGAPFLMTETSYNVVYTVSLNINGKSYYINKTVEAQGLIKIGSHDYYVGMRNLLCYPDARAETVTVYILWKKTAIRKDIYKFKQVPANNIAYVRIEDNSYMYSAIPIKRDATVLMPDNLSSKTNVIYQSNKLQVSAVNNPFYYAADNIYTIGENSSTIDAINTAAEQVSETKFGVYPLYVFTDRSIHAMEVGDGEVLYRNVIGISNERKLPTTTTVGAANVVFFISDQGVMALEGRRAFCISGPLDDNPELPTRDFMKYISSARLSYNPKYGELIVCNPTYEYAYVYSIASKVWSRRDWLGEPLSTFELIMDDGIYSTIEEDKSKPYSKISIVTRAIKLGSLEYKRVETVLARMLNGAQTSFTIMLEGSNDLQTWRSLITVTDIKLLRRTMASYIYHRVRIEAFVSDHFSLTHFDVEYYNRFVRRLR